MKKIIKLFGIILFSAFSFLYLTGCPLFPQPANTFTVEFDTNGGSVVENQIIEKGKLVIEPKDPTHDHATFIGWDLGSVRYDFNNPVNSNLKLVASYDYDEYSVTFDSDGGSAVDTVNIDYNTKVSKPIDPTKTGYTFDGWYNGTTLYDFDTLIIEPLTLKAKWAIIENTVTFDSTGGSAVDSINVAYGNTLARPADPTRTGYQFNGWYQGNQLYSFDTVVNEPLTLIASWKANEHTVTFDSDNGRSNKSIIAAYDQRVPYNFNPDKAGYTFNGWYKDDILYDFNDLVKGDITLKAKWLVSTYNVTFDCDGGSSVEPQNIIYNDRISEPIPPTKEGFIFVDWYMGDRPYNFYTQVTSAVTLKAIWEEDHRFDDFINYVDQPNYTISILQKKTELNTSSVVINAQYKVKQINDVIYYLYQNWKQPNVYGANVHIANSNLLSGYGFGINQEEGLYFYSNPLMNQSFWSFELDRTKMAQQANSSIYNITLNNDDLLSLTAYNDWSSYTYTFDLESMELLFTGLRAGYQLETTITFSNLGTTDVEMPLAYQKAIETEWEESLLAKHYSVEMISEDSITVLETYLNKYQGLWEASDSLDTHLFIYEDAMMEMDTLAITVDPLKVTKVEAIEKINNLFEYFKEFSTAASILDMQDELNYCISTIEFVNSIKDVQDSLEYAIWKINEVQVTEEAKLSLHNAKIKVSNDLNLFLVTYSPYVNMIDYLTMKEIVDQYISQVYQAVDEEEITTLFNLFISEMYDSSLALQFESLTSYKNSLASILQGAYGNLTLANFDFASYLLEKVRIVKNTETAIYSFKSYIECNEEIRFLIAKQNAINDIQNYYDSHINSALYPDLMENIRKTYISQIEIAVFTNQLDTLYKNAFERFAQTYVYSELKYEQNTAIAEMKNQYQQQLVLSQESSSTAMEDVLNRYIARVNATSLVEEIDDIKEAFWMELLTVSVTDLLKASMYDKIYSLKIFLESLDPFVLDEPAFYSLNQEYEALKNAFMNGLTLEQAEEKWNQLILHADALEIRKLDYINSCQLSYPSWADDYLKNMKLQTITDMENATGAYEIYHIYIQGKSKLDLEVTKIWSVNHTLNLKFELLYKTASDLSREDLSFIRIDYELLIQQASNEDQVRRLLSQGIQALNDAYVYSEINAAKISSSQYIWNQVMYYLDTSTLQSYGNMMTLYSNIVDLINNANSVLEIYQLRNNFITSVLELYDIDQSKLKVYENKEIVGKFEEYTMTNVSGTTLASLLQATNEYHELYWQDKSDYEKMSIHFNNFKEATNAVALNDEYYTHMIDELTSIVDGTDTKQMEVLNSAEAYILSSKQSFDAYECYFNAKVEIQLIQHKNLLINQFNDQYTMLLTTAIEEVKASLKSTFESHSKLILDSTSKDIADSKYQIASSTLSSVA